MTSLELAARKLPNIGQVLQEVFTEVQVSEAQVEFWVDLLSKVRVRFRVRVRVRVEVSVTTTITLVRMMFLVCGDVASSTLPPCKFNANKLGSVINVSRVLLWCDCSYGAVTS